MKLACASPAVPGNDWSEKLENLSNWGYDAIAVFTPPQRWTQAEEEQLLSVSRKIGIPVCEFAFIGEAIGSLMSADSRRRDENRNLVQQAIQICSRFGAVTEIEYECMAVNPMPSHDHAQYQELTEAQEREFSALYQEFCDVDAGVPVLLETLNRYESRYMNLQRQGQRLLSLVKRGNAGLLCDLFHMSLDEFCLYDALHSGGSLVKHIHLADTNRRSPGRGYLDFGRIFRTLKQIDYQGYFVLECTLQRDSKQDLIDTAEFLRRVYNRA